MSEATYMNPSGIADPSPSGFTAVVKAGNTVYIAGMVAQDENGNVVGEGDAEAQTRQIWHNIGVAVQAAGGSLADIVKTTTYVTGIEHGAAVRRVRGELFPAESAHQHPAGRKRTRQPRLRSRNRVHRGNRLTASAPPIRRGQQISERSAAALISLGFAPPFLQDQPHPVPHEPALRFFQPPADQLAHGQHRLPREKSPVPRLLADPALQPIRVSVGDSRQYPVQGDVPIVRTGGHLPSRRPRAGLFPAHPRGSA